MARLAWWGAFVALSAATGAARAQPPPPTVPIAAALSTDGPDDCVSTDGLAEQVSGWLERDTLDARLTVHVRIEGSPPDSVSFVIKQAGRPVAWRQFLDPPAGCADVRAAVALAIALAIDATILESLGVLVPEQPPRREDPTPPPVAAPAPPPPSPAPAPAAEGRILDAGGALEGAVYARVLPAAVPGAYGGLWVRWRSLEVRLGALATSAAEAPLGRGEVHASLAATRLDACFVRPVESLTFQSCGGVATGQISARGRGFDDSRETLVRWTALALRLGARVPLGDVLSATAAVDGLSPLVRPRLVVVDPSGSAVHEAQAPAAGAAVSLGVTAAFP